MSKSRSEKRNAILVHIKEYYPEFEALKKDVRSAAWIDNLTRQGATHLVTGGCFLIYYTEVKSFMRECGYDARFSEERMWELYIQEIATVIMTCIKNDNYNFEF
jgi:tartrate dehydratase beta subunit/fumarate hydratase class I family protein